MLHAKVKHTLPGCVWRLRQEACIEQDWLFVWLLCGADSCTWWLVIKLDGLGILENACEYVQRRYNVLGLLEI